MKQILVHMILIALVVGCTGPSPRTPIDPADDLTEADREARVVALLQPVVAKLTDLAGEKKIGFGQFLKDGRDFEPAVSRYVISRLTKLLVAGGAKLIERRDLDKIIAELEFQLSDLVNSDTRVAIGELSGIDMLLLGTVQDLSLNVYRIEIKLEEMQTARILMTESIDLDRKYLPVKFGGK